MNKLTLSTLSVLAFGVLTANANLLVNGSFDDNGTHVYANYGLWQTYSSITGWSNTGYVEIQDNGLYGASSVAADGSNWLELDSYASYTISQGFGAVAGQTYTLTFDYAGRPDAPAYDDVMKVSVNGTALSFNTGVSPANGALNWTTGSITFTSTGSDHISFSDGGPNDSYGMLLDNVSIDTPAVPEPTSMGLFGMGLLGLFGMARARSKRKQA